MRNGAKSALVCALLLTMAFCVVGFITTINCQLATSPASQDQLDRVSGWVEKCPGLQDTVCECLEDDRMDRDDYRLILDVYRGLKYRDTLDDLAAPCGVTDD